MWNNVGQTFAVIYFYEYNSRKPCAFRNILNTLQTYQIPTTEARQWEFLLQI